MFNNLTLERPLAILDLETTGTSIKDDRIVEISVLKILPIGTEEHWTRRVNPGIAIPAEATEIHGITDADVAAEPRLQFVAESLIAFLAGCDLCGFNIKRFDLPLLCLELSRIKANLPLDDRAIVDLLEIFNRYERHDLAAAVKFYCGKEHSQAHKAAADVLATAQVLDSMLGRYDGLPRSIFGLDQHFRDPNSVDLMGNFVKVQGEVCFTFGKHSGRPLDKVAKTDRSYLEWMLKEDFLMDSKALIRQALGVARPPIRMPRAIGEAESPG